jgi:uncharacterized protein (TIGR00304 family)
MADLTVFYSVGIALVVVGFIVIIAAIILASVGGKRQEKEGETHAAGVIMIGPIPIIFGTDKKAVKSVLALTLAVMVVAAVVLVIYFLLLR